ncbi:hypothetical protein A9D36_00090 [Bacillus subtilis]|nr:hypothetical protein A9D36_00090 [Bacillus subtilis]
MNRSINDATLVKVGDIFQYYIALRDCFKLKNGDKLQIEVNGDVSIVAAISKKSFQREVKHHFGEKKLSDRDVDFWKTLSNWYIEHNRITTFSSLILHTTATISSDSPFYNWNTKDSNDKITVLQSIGQLNKKREETFRKYYNKIFAEEIYDEIKLLDILSRFTIESSQNQISGISKEFSSYIGHIPENNRDNYIGALLGRIVSIVKDPPHRWEVTREEFDKILQQESPAYSSPNEQPLPSDFAEVNIPEQTAESLLNKEFVEAIRKIEYNKQIPDAVSDYWKAEMTVMKYFKDDFLYLKSLPLYKNELERQLKYVKESKVIETEGMNRNIEIKISKLMYTEVMRWDVKDFGSIVRNQGYFQRGIIHTIVDDKKFSWDVGEEDEY